MFFSCWLNDYSFGILLIKINEKFKHENKKRDEKKAN